MVEMSLIEFCSAQKDTDFLLFLMTGSTSYAHGLTNVRHQQTPVCNVSQSSFGADILSVGPGGKPK